MLVNVFNYYGSVQAPCEVIPILEACEQSPALQAAKEALKRRVVFDWELLQMLFALALSLITCLFMIRMAEIPIVEAYLLTSLVIYISLFVDNARKYLLKAPLS